MHKSPINTDDFIRTSTAARILGVSSETARGWANTGRLHVTKTLDGMRLFSLSECERLRLVYDEHCRPVSPITRSWWPSSSCCSTASTRGGRSSCWRRPKPE